ncbi:MAG TPA: diacylglycerol kinase family protein [Candidatus Acidoferrales bacterium]|nr:diacylglycerol kinase family protein [Candidatus Acidoferrales bacterium]
MNTEKTRFLAIMNPAAGGGRCGALAPAALERVRCALDANGATLATVQTKKAGEATELARAAYTEGIRHFLAVGGDGTSYEIINGIFPESLENGRISLGFLPLGTGNSFLRDFTTEGVEQTIAAIAEGRSRVCDVIRARHATGEIYFINVLNLGFPADVAELTNRRFKSLGETGYILAVFGRLAWLFYGTFPHRVGSRDWDRRPSLFLAFTNSKFTGGKMMIAPKADSANGKIEYVRWAPIGRARLLWLFPRLFTGTHIDHPLATRAAVDRVSFDLGEPVNVVVDGENLKLKLQSLEILPAALDVIV